jgi:hypothetical protein
MNIGYARVSGASLPAACGLSDQPGYDIAPSRLLRDVERHLPRPGSGPIEIGTVHQQVLRCRKLPTVTGVPKPRGELLGLGGGGTNTGR